MKIKKIKQTLSKIIALSFYCITLCVFCQVFNGSASAISGNSVNDFYFQSFSADYYLSRDEDGTSRLKVIERLTAVFPEYDQNHGITRLIPYTNQDGQNLTMASDQNLQIQIKHNEISEEPYSVVSSDGYFTIHIGDVDSYVHGRQIYELEYEFENVITEPKDNPGHQELYWDTNGNDWSQRFENVNVRVHFTDEEIANSFDGEVSCYVGKYKEKGIERCKVTPIADGIEFSAQNLNARENLTFDLEFDANTFTMPSKVYDYRVLRAVGIEAVVAIVLLIIIVAILLQTKDKREYYKGLFVTPEYTPPKDFTVAEMSRNYIGQKIAGSTKTATLIELAVTHKVELSKLGTTKEPRWTVKILSTDLSDEQIDLLKLLTGRDNELRAGEEILIQTDDYVMSKMSSGLHSIADITARYTNEQKYDQDIDRRMLADGLCDAKFQDKTKRLKYKTNLCDVLLTCGVFWIMVCFIAMPFVFDEWMPSYVISYGGGWLIAVAVIFAVAIAVVAFWAGDHYQKFYTHTKDGLKWSRYLDGLKLYIKMAEQDRIKLLQSVNGVDVSNQGIVKLYEKLLPYAIIFRLETSWIKEMEKYYALKDVNSPDWYRGDVAFSAYEFSTIMRHFSSTVLADHSSSSGSSSSSSGSSGGGFSGGGGGGGGGGGW